MEKNFEIVIFFNKYKDTLDDFINSSNLESLNQSRLINKKLCNTPRFKASLIELLERFYLNENISDSLAWQILETRNFQVYQHRNIIFFDFKSEII